MKMAKFKVTWNEFVPTKEGKTPGYWWHPSLQQKGAATVEDDGITVDYTLTEGSYEKYMTKDKDGETVMDPKYLLFYKADSEIGQKITAGRAK